MSQKNASVGDVLTQLREYEVKKEVEFTKAKADLESSYAKKEADLAKSIDSFSEKQQAQYELKLKDVKLLAKKGAKSDVASLNKDFSAQLSKAKKIVAKGKTLVLKNLV